MSSSLCTLLDDITREVLPYIDIILFTDTLWDALMSLLFNLTRTDSLVILYLKRKKTKSRAFWRLWHLFMEFNQYTSVLLLMITFEVFFFPVYHDCYTVTRYFWLLRLEFGLCSHLPPSGRTQVLRKKLPLRCRCSCTTSREEKKKRII